MIMWGVSKFEYVELWLQFAVRNIIYELWCFGPCMCVLLYV